MKKNTLYFLFFTMFVACTKKSDPVVNPVVTVPVVVNPTSAPVINKNTIIYNNNGYDNLGPYNLQLLSNTTSAGFVMAGIFGNHYIRVVFPKGRPTVSMTIPMTKTSTDLQTDFQLDLVHYYPTSGSAFVDVSASGVKVSFGPLTFSTDSAGVNPVVCTASLANY